MALVQKSNPKRNIIMLSILAGVIVVSVIVYLIIRPKSSDQNIITGGDFGIRTQQIVTDFGDDVYRTAQFGTLHDYLTSTNTSTIQPPDTTSGGNQHPFDPH